MGRYSFIGSGQNFSGQEIGHHHGLGKFNRVARSGNLFADIQRMRCVMHSKARQGRLSGLAGLGQRPGHLSGAGFWFNR